MEIGQEKIKDYFSAKKEKINSRIEQTPMEKFFLLFLVIITVSAVILGYLQFQKNIKSPLYYSYLERKRGELRTEYNLINLNIDTLGKAEIKKLQSQDSDLDGLDDYSEIYIYKTSPYLEDSDNDGIWDKDEVFNGTDPNCPQGQTCQQPLEVPSGLSGGPVENATSSQELNINTSGYDEIFQLLNTSGAENINAEDKQQVLDTLKNLTPAEIRQELIKRGMDQSLLDKIDDQTLKAYFLQTLNSL
jgi:hypothetical protein